MFCCKKCARIRVVFVCWFAFICEREMVYKNIHSQIHTYRIPKKKNSSMLAVKIVDKNTNEERAEKRNETNLTITTKQTTIDEFFSSFVTVYCILYRTQHTHTSLVYIIIVPSLMCWIEFSVCRYIPLGCLFSDLFELTR